MKDFKFLFGLWFVFLPFTYGNSAEIEPTNLSVDEKLVFTTLGGVQSISDVQSALKSKNPASLREIHSSLTKNLGNSEVDWDTDTKKKAASILDGLILKANDMEKEKKEKEEAEKKKAEEEKAAAAKVVVSPEKNNLMPRDTPLASGGNQAPDRSAADLAREAEVHWKDNKGVAQKSAVLGNDDFQRIKQTETGAKLSHWKFEGGKWEKVGFGMGQEWIQKRNGEWVANKETLGDIDKHDSFSADSEAKGTHRVFSYQTDTGKAFNDAHGRYPTDSESEYKVLNTNKDWNADSWRVVTGTKFKELENKPGMLSEYWKVVGDKHVKANGPNDEGAVKWLFDPSSKKWIREREADWVAGEGLQYILNP